MKRLLRSIIDFGNLPQAAMAANLQKLVTSQPDWGRTDDERIFRFTLGYFRQRLEMPSARTVMDYFERSGDIEAQERIKDIATATPYIRTNFAHLLQTLMEDQNKVKALMSLKEAQEILTKGLMVDKEKLQGVQDAFMYLSRRGTELIVPESNVRLRGNIREDSEIVWDEYQQAKHNKDKAWGRFTGLDAIDTICHGIKKGELWIHAGYAGEMKTTMATNWCYNLITRYRTNIYYVSLEMKYEHIRRLLYVMHSTNAVFRMQGKAPLDYRRVRDGELTPEEEAFFQAVIKDFGANTEYCDFDTYAPDRDVTMDDVKMETELLHRQKEIGMVVIDHGGLAEARKSKRHKDYTIELNSVIRDAKKLALHFNGGEGIPVLLLFQINRTGKDQADKADGKYRMSALAYANEAERSADVITTTYLNDDLRKKGLVKVSNLKNRDNPLFETFEASVDFTARRIRGIDPFQGMDGQGMTVDDHRNTMDAMWNV